MYYYMITEYDDDITLIHEKRFNEEEFDKMCMEAPIHVCSMLGEYRDIAEMRTVLVTKYGFKEVKYEARYHIRY